MVNHWRQTFNAAWTEEKYQHMLSFISQRFNHTPKFRIAETPVFISPDFEKKLLAAGEAVVGEVASPDFKSIDFSPIQPMLVPGEAPHPMFLVVDFGVCESPDGSLEPKLIEIQGFPSLFYYQLLLAEAFKTTYPFLSGHRHLFGVNEAEYIRLMNGLLLGGHAPENVVLIDYDPANQATAIDFFCTQAATGIAPICITQVKRSGRELYYLNAQGKKTAIHRIYNRLIFDELDQHPELKLEFSLREEVDVEWAGHPNWYFKVSKYILPFLKSDCVPASQFLSDVKTSPADLENYVLKPLFSFAGSGVIFDVTAQDLAKISQPEHYLLQRKEKYASFLEAPDGMVKSEIRLLYVWEDGQERPRLVHNLCRLSKGQLIGVKFNKNKTWVGGSICFFEP